MHADWTAKWTNFTSIPPNTYGFEGNIMFPNEASSVLVEAAHQTTQENNFFVSSPIPTQ